MFCASASSPVETLEGISSLGPVDIRGLLGSIQAPVLVLHRTGDRLADVNASRYMAERIPGARLVELPGDDHLPFFGDQDSVVALVQEFLTGALPAADPDRVLATAPFTDLVDSTGLAAGMGDRRWHRVLVEHQELVRRQLARFGGQEVKTTGDGFLATFDGPARAIRAGLHTGEVELLRDDIGGIAVHIAARVLAKAGPGRSCARGRSRTWSPGPGSPSPSAAPTGSRASPAPGSCTPSSPPSGSATRPQPPTRSARGVSAMRASTATRPSGCSEGARRASSSRSPRLPSIRS